MKKFLSIFVSALLVLGFVSIVRAEMSPSSASGKSYTDNQVFLAMYNNSGSPLTSNSVVIIDTGGTAGTTLGSYFTTTTSTCSSYIIGVTDETIQTGAVGRVCIRGPHRVRFTTAPSAGDSVSSSTTAGRASTQTATANKDGYLGTALAVTGSTDPYYGTDVWWVWIRPNVQ